MNKKNQELLDKVKGIITEHLIVESPKIKEIEEALDKAQDDYWNLVYNLLEKSCSQINSQEVKNKFEKAQGKELTYLYEKQHGGFPCILNPNFEKEIELTNSSDICASCRDFREQAGKAEKGYLEVFIKIFQNLVKNDPNCR